MTGLDATDPDGIRDVLESHCAAALGRPAAEAELEYAAKYLELLLKWQKTQRLVASDDPGWIARSLIADSLLFLRVLPPSARRIVDIGSGAGFPGIPLKIFRPDLSIALIEARQRRASFLRAVVRELALEDVEVHGERLEAVSHHLLGSFDAATMRCAGEPGALVAPTLRLVRPGGMVVASGPPPSERPDVRRTRRGGRETGRSATPLEIVVVSGAGTRDRQFLVARKP